MKIGTGDQVTFRNTRVPKNELVMQNVCEYHRVHRSDEFRVLGEQRLPRRALLVERQDGRQALVWASLLKLTAEARRQRLSELRGAE